MSLNTDGYILCKFQMLKKYKKILQLQTVGEHLHKGGLNIVHL